MFINYYDILDLDENCTKSDVKKAFRKKIKIYHPDLKGHRAEYNESSQIIIKAYNILFDEQSRGEFDRKLDIFRANQFVKFDYRTFLQKQGDERSYAKLIMFELYQNNDDFALNVFFNHRSSIYDYLEKTDLMDCLLMLSEECIRQEKYLESFDIINDIIFYENKKPYFRNFFEFVIDLLKITIDNIVINYSFDESFSKIYQVISSNISNDFKNYFVEKGINLCKKQKDDDKIREFLYAVSNKHF